MRATSITRRRLDPDALESAVTQHLAVSDAVQCDASSKTEIVDSGVLRQTCA